MRGVNVSVHDGVSSGSIARDSAALRGGETALASSIGSACDWIDARESEIAALLPEPARRERLLREAAELDARFPDPDMRPALFGVLAGIKDIFHVDGFTTRAGSSVPPELFAGPEAACVERLREAGALILGKTVTTEFAGSAPNGTRNPHNPAHTPGGSSSGSAAAVAAGYCQLALGSQTVGSVIRPAAFCGIVGFKPTYDRIPTAGTVYYARSVDTVGLFTRDVASAALAAAALCDAWQPVPSPSPAMPVLGIPDGAYLNQASPEGLQGFERQVELLEKAGYTVKRVSALDDIARISERHYWITKGEAAAMHRDWYAAHAERYRPQTVEVIETGLAVTPEQLAEGLASRAQVRGQLESVMDEMGIDLWICPAAPGPAPEGIDSTGDPVMNLLWTHTGMPVVSLPAGRAANGLPLGLQVIGRFNTDETLLAWAEPLSAALADA
jgi:Asp-tRNA(Asn)/Glu-tRNA(Gln) amidotransferase A subunit family amidase